ncbi:Transcription initiation factor TFIID subunit 9B, variant 2 [Trebouxia sp. C0009 RCD-2024]
MGAVAARTARSRRSGTGDVLPLEAKQFRLVPGTTGIKDYEPRVVQQLLDFVYRNVAEVLQVAEAFSNRASKKRNWDGGCHASYSSKSNYIPLLPLLRRTPCKLWQIGVTRSRFQYLPPSMASDCLHLRTASSPLTSSLSTKTCRRRGVVGEQCLYRSRDTASHCAALKIIESLPRCAS